MKKVYLNFKKMIKNEENDSKIKSSWMNINLHKFVRQHHRIRYLLNRVVALLSVIASPGFIGAWQSHKAFGFSVKTCCLLRSPRRPAASSRCTCQLRNKFKLLNICKSFYYWGIAHIFKTPGLDVHRKIVSLYLSLWRNKKITFDQFYNNAVYPLDSVRYFEFDFFLKYLTNKESIGNYLDVSSPRMLFTLLLLENPDLKARIINPDLKDLNISKKLIDNLKLSQRVEFNNQLIDELYFPEGSFNTITCMSVIEHIPNEKDKRAIEKLWSLLKPGGSLIISVPVCKVAYEEYIDIDYYGLLEKENGYVFGQRFYDEKLIAEWKEITTNPVSMLIYGEKSINCYNNSRENKLIFGFRYPTWKEPYFVGRNFKYFDNISSMPGIGVACMVFVKEILDQ